MDVVLTSNGSTGHFPHTGLVTFATFGTFSGATVTPETSFDGGTTWIAIEDSSGDSLEHTADRVTNIEIGTCILRATLSSAGGGTSVRVVFNNVR